MSRQTLSCQGLMFLSKIKKIKKFKFKVDLNSTNLKYSAHNTFLLLTIAMFSRCILHTSYRAINIPTQFLFCFFTELQGVRLCICMHSCAYALQHAQLFCFRPETYSTQVRERRRFCASMSLCVVEHTAIHNATHVCIAF